MSYRCPFTKSKSRYGVRKVKAEGARGTMRAYGSAGEAARAAVLRLLEERGLIRDLCYQVPFQLRVNSVLIETYIADFTYTRTDDGVDVVEDFKNGLITGDYKRKRRWMKAAHGITIYESGRGTGTRARGSNPTKGVKRGRKQVV